MDAIDVVKAARKVAKDQRERANDLMLAESSQSRLLVVANAFEKFADAIANSCEKDTE